MSVKSKLEKYLSHRDYVDQIPLDYVGTFQVLGEESGSCRGGNLGVYRGKFKDVLEYAMELPGFYTWGNGGPITELKIKDITADSSKNRKRLLEEKKTLKSKLDEINALIGEDDE